MIGADFIAGFVAAALSAAAPDPTPRCWYVDATTLVCDRPLLGVADTFAIKIIPRGTP